jgi:hypothetical protein
MCRGVVWPRRDDRPFTVSLLGKAASVRYKDPLLN